MNQRRPTNQRHRQKAETRRRLLDAATNVFMEDPPITASLEEIATRAGVRRQTLIYHFGNRTGLMYEVLMHHLEFFRSQMDEFRGDLQLRLETYLRAHRTPLVRLLLHLDELTSDTPRSPHEPAPDKAGYWYPVVLADLERHLVDTGIDPEDAHKRAPVLASALLHMAQRVARDQATEDEMSNFVETACDMVLASKEPADQATTAK